MISSRFLHIACCSCARKNSVSAEHVKSVVVQWWFGQFCFHEEQPPLFLHSLEDMTGCSFVPSISVRIFVWLSDGFLPCCSCWRPSHVLPRYLPFRMYWYGTCLELLKLSMACLSVSLRYIHCGSLCIYWLIIQMYYMLDTIIYDYVLNSVHKYGPLSAGHFLQESLEQFAFCCQGHCCNSLRNEYEKRRNYMNNEYPIFCSRCQLVADIGFRRPSLIRLAANNKVTSRSALCSSR